MRENICLFVPYHKDYQAIHTINFVLETTPKRFDTLVSQSVYKIYYVCDGTGVLHTASGNQNIGKGDVFFTFPNFPFAIESKDNLKYMYISFLGGRASMLMEKFHISKRQFWFSGYEKLCLIWENGIVSHAELSDLASESVLLATFAALGERTLETEKENKDKTNLSLYIKRYIDDNFANPNVSLASIANHLCYNKKYISTVFKKETDIGVVEYLNTLRIQNACTLMNQGFTSVGDIAHSCGFSDPQYFSKVFKHKLKKTPMQYIKALKTI